MRKRLLSVFLVLCMLLGLLPTTMYAANGTHPFTDVNEGDWFSEAVQYVYQNGLMCGTEDDYTMNGDYIGDTDILDNSTEKHPMYQVFDKSKAGEMWVIYVVSGEVFANPLSFNFGTTGLDAEVLVIEESNSGKLASYYGKTNSFYVTIPKDTAVFTKAVEGITADTLDEITINALCELTGATQRAPPEDDSSGLLTVHQNAAGKSK